MTPGSVKAAAILADGKPVQIVAGGKTYDVKAEVGESPKDMTIVHLLQTLLEADRIKNEDIKRLTEQVSELRKAVEKNTQATQSVIDDNKEVLQSISQLDKTLRLPVIGERKDGKLIARRQSS